MFDKAEEAASLEKLYEKLEDTGSQIDGLKDGVKSLDGSERSSAKERIESLERRRSKIRDTIEKREREKENE